jgi:hypothetical protein
MAIYSMTITQRAPLLVNPVDKFGITQPVENLVFSVLDPTISTIEVDETGVSWVVATGLEGQTEVTAIADVMIGEGVRNISESFTLAVSHTLAVNLGFGIGEPVEKI